MRPSSIALILLCATSFSCRTNYGNGPLLDDIVAPEKTTSQYEAGTCDAISPKIKELVIEDFSMAGINMFGCSEAFPLDPTTCLMQFTDEESWVDHSQLRNHRVKLLRKLQDETSYWVRSSADGRFVAPGNGRIHDLKPTESGEPRFIVVQDATIDAAFSPNNQYYAWIGMICKQSVLYDPTVKEVGVDIPGSQCTANSFNDYASIGASGNGREIVFKNYSSTNVGNVSGEDSYIKGEPETLNNLTMGIIENTILTDREINFQFAGEQDYLISPSGKLMVGRLVDSEPEEDGFDEFYTQKGYRVRMLRPNGRDLDPTNNATIATICLQGEKPNISFDNRFVTFHHYTTKLPDQTASANPREQIQDVGATPGAANIFIYDLQAAKGYRITNMPRNSSALFPHFRADGWLYFQVKTTDPASGDSSEFLAATDAAIQIIKQGQANDR